MYWSTCWWINSGESANLTAKTQKLNWFIGSVSTLYRWTRAEKERPPKINENWYKSPWFEAKFCTDEIHLGTNLFPKNHAHGLTQTPVNLVRSHELEFFPKTKSAWFVVLKWRICQGTTLALITHVLASKSLKKFNPIAAKTDDQKSTKMAPKITPK